MIRIALIGGAGCGKTSQCAHFFSMLKYDSIVVEQIQEWVRDALNQNLIPDPRQNPWVQAYIYDEQRQKEDYIPKEVNYIVTDSPTILSYVYTLMNAKIPQDHYLIKKMYSNFINDISRYDYIFFCKREKTYQKDGTRYQTSEEAEKLDKIIIYLLELHNIPYTILTGTPEERTKIMREKIGI